MEKWSRKRRAREFFLLSLASLAVLLIVFGLMFGMISLDDSPNKCASKIAAKIYDTKCF